MDWSVFQAPALMGVLVVLDIAVGFAGTAKNKDVKPNKPRSGLWHKAGFMGLIALTYAILTEIVFIFENPCVLNPALVNSPSEALFAHTDKIENAEIALLEAGE